MSAVRARPISKEIKTHANFLHQCYKGEFRSFGFPFFIDQKLKLNSMPLKQSYNQYRQIKGKYFECWEFDSSRFEEQKEIAKKLGLAYRIIDGQFYRERPNNDDRVLQMK